MATSRKLLSLLGKSTRSASLRAVVAADNLRVSKEEDLEDGSPASVSFTGKKAGYEITAEDGRVVAVFLHVTKADGFAAFPSPLPFELPQDANRKDVRRLLGKPECSGKAHRDKILGHQPTWDRFAIGSIRIHIEYTDAELQISLLTLMTEDSAP